MTNEDENWEKVDKTDDFLAEYELNCNYPDLIPNQEQDDSKIKDEIGDFETKLDFSSQNAAISFNELSSNLNFLSTSVSSGRRIKTDRKQSFRNDLTDDDDDDNNSIDSLSVKNVEISDENDEFLGEYSLVDERKDLKCWQKVILSNGEKRMIDMRVIEPYKRVLTHGGYLRGHGSNAIILFSACFLPDKARIDYDYVMDNLSMYILKTLNELVTDEYTLVYFHGSAVKNCLPSYSWLRRSYDLIDRKLRKNLLQLLIVHPNFFFRTIVMMTKPFISSKFYRKLVFVKGIEDLFKRVPALEPSSIPDEILQFDKLKIGR